LVFFNYSTMQMAAKVVYYGPGLCGKTTNLHHIYQQTAADSRGEMVSLETETDRTLFFDLLPIDVGNVGGFKTRIQLYTVPGQVFYNTTRKLVLKGVDGVVFVADSQRPMLDANAESLRNLEENLAETGVDSDSMPVVLQYNKRDLKDVCSVEEMNRALNPKGWPFFEASALKGDGVFETLRGISRLTLASVRKRLGEGSQQPAPAPRPTVVVPAAPPAPAAPAAAPPKPFAVESRPVPAAPAPRPAPPPPAPAAAPPAAPKPAAAAVSPRTQAVSADVVASAVRRQTSQINVVQEIENLRKQAMRPSGSGSTGALAAAAPPTAASPDGTKELHRSLQLKMPRQHWEQARKLVINLDIADGNQHALESLRDLKIDLEQPSDASKLVLRLSVVLTPRD
jgi:small GTP-binding protein